VTAAVASANLILGLVYTQYGLMTLYEMIRHRRDMGFSHFGAAWIAMAFTCGPHHLVHGVHTAFEGRMGGPMDLIVVLVGFPAGVAWYLLRLEAFFGGRGDRFWSGNPWYVLVLPTLAGAYVSALVFAGIGLAPYDTGRILTVLPNLFLVGIYCTIGYFLARTQIANHKPLGGWSVSGLALTIVFPTCAAMHGTYALYTLNTRYAADVHGLFVDWFAVPAGLYFLWVVMALARGTFRDWNGSPFRESSGSRGNGAPPMEAAAASPVR
jgi:hypothetical protein